MKPLLGLSLLLVLVSPDIPQQPAELDRSPHARHGHRLAYDTRNEVTVLFGGRSADGEVLDDTWTWDGLRWTLISQQGPSPRVWFALAHDTARGLVVLHGGRDSTGTALSDTWAWDGTTWRLVSTQGPEARDHHAMAYDSARKHLLMFGGYDNETRLSRDDTWAWDGQAWTPLASPQRPGPRDAHSLAFVSQRNELVVFGGMNVHDGETTIWGDTWGWDGAQWQVREVATAAGRSHSAMAYDGRCECVWRFGGGDRSRTPVGGTWRLDDDGWDELPVASPSARVDHAMAYDPSRQRVVLFGGYVPGTTGAVFGDTWEWDGEAWERR